jgi:hypothetical protein
MDLFKDSHAGHALCAFGFVLVSANVHVLALLEVCINSCLLYSFDHLAKIDSVNAGSMLCLC